MGFKGFIVPLPPFTAKCEQCGKPTRHVYLGNVVHGEDRIRQCERCGLKTRERGKK